VAKTLGIRLVTVPTIASTDAATSRVIAMYDDNHRLVETPTMAENPEVVIVDTGLICAAPARFLVSGIGDAIAKLYEASACARGNGLTSNGTRPLALPLVIAEACHHILLQEGASAVDACEAGVVTPELDRVVEAVVLMSGLAFENGGLSLAHSMTRGLMALPGTASALHGLHVAYGLLVQVTHEGRQDVAAELRSFYRRVGLPSSLRQLGEAPTEAVLRTLSTVTLTSPHLANCVPRPDVASLIAAILEVEADVPSMCS
jgi:glycerol dehydrogenase